MHRERFYSKSSNLRHILLDNERRLSYNDEQSFRRRMPDRNTEEDLAIDDTTMPNMLPYKYQLYNVVYDRIATNASINNVEPHFVVKYFGLINVFQGS